MIIHQAFYGEVNRGHSCISQTLANSDLTSFLISFTDRPAALPPGVVLQPYFSGAAWSNYYIFTKTFPDQYATRSGMVFTHALILNLDSLKFINNLNDVFCNFIETVPENRGEINDIEFSISTQIINSNNRFLPSYIKECVSSLLSGKLPISFSGDNQSFENIIQQIWNAPNIELRKKIRFRTSFTPSDIEGIKNLTIVSIQKDFLSKWSDRTIIDADNNELIEITSHSEALFLGSKEDNPFYSFLIDLNVDQSNFSNFGQLDKVFNDYNKITDIDNADIIRQNIRVLSKVSPSINDGMNIKNRFINRLTELIELGTEKNFKALRNIEWDAIENGEQRMRLVFSGFIEKELNNPLIDVPNLAELIDLAFYEEKKKWWHETVKGTLKQIFNRCTKPVIENLWKIVTHTDKIIDDIFDLLPANTYCESILREKLPIKIKESTIIKLENISKKRNWFLFHADILLKYLEPKDAIVNQLKFESNLALANSVGVLYLIEKLDDKQLLSLTLSNCNDKLIHQTANRISKNKNILNNVDVKNPCWLNIWALSIATSKNFSNGIEGREIELVNSILDLIISDESVPDSIIESISKSEFSDISKYGKRNDCWNKISPKHKQGFIEKTSKGVLRQYIKNEISFDSIENPLLNHISSDNFMTGFLSENRNNIEPVINVYESFSNLKDTFLADYIKYFNKSISGMESKKLGSIVLKKNYSLSAQNIYEKSKYNDSFIPAYEVCKSLVRLSWWNDLWNDNKKDKGKKNWDHQELDKTNDFKMIKKLPTIVILTAIQEEYLAVRQHLNSIIDADQNNTSYEAGIFEFNEKPIAKVIIRECGPKNTNASQETERAIQNFTPDCIFFVGIAGSRKPKDFAIGDVIFPEKIYSYEGGKSEKESFKARPDFADTDYSLRELSKKERIRGDWKTLIKGEWPKDVKADIGIIASGEQVVEHYNSDVGIILTEHYNDASVVEMEGFGFAKAANRQGRQYKNMIVGVVRGISDIIGQPDDKQENPKTEKRPANVKNFAADTAAAFAYWLIYKTYND